MLLVLQMMIKPLLFLFSIALAGTLPLSHAQGQEAPNIIYILMDDAGYGDLSCYGQKKFQTPNIDRLATEGMKFTQHYAGSTVCAPTRSVLMTGLHTGHTPNRGNRELKPVGQHPLPADTLTIAESLKAAGYATGAFGKWGLGAPGSEGDPVNQGFDRFYGYNCQRNAHTYRPTWLYSDLEKVTLDGKTYSHDIIMAECLEWLNEQAADKTKPFFCYIPTPIPHAAMDVPEDDCGPWRKVFPQFEDKVGKYGGDTVTNPVAQFAGMMTRLDREVGKVLAVLAEHGIDDNTIVLLSSDNGPHKEGGHQPDFFDSNGPLTGYKRNLTEGGIRAPLVARWPGKIPAGSVSDHISAHWDMFPTFCEIAGTEIPEGLDGISLVSELKGNSADQTKHQYLYWEFSERGGKRATRFGPNGKWKAIQLDCLNKKKGPGPIQLFNLEDDIAEKNNLASKFPERVQEAEKIFEEAHTPSEFWPFIGD